MKFLDILDLVPDTFIPKKNDFISMYKKSLKLLNELQCSRFNAMYFGSLNIGPDFYSWKDEKEFVSKYQSCCIYIMNDLYSKLKSNQSELVELSLSILYSMLAQYVSMLDLDDNELESLLNTNDKFKTSEEFNNAFSRKDEVDG